MVNGTLPGIPTEFFDLDFIGSTVSFALAGQKANPINFSGLLDPKFMAGSTEQSWHIAWGARPARWVVPDGFAALTAGDPDRFGTGEECSYAAHLMGRLALKLSSSSVAPFKFLIPPLACALNHMGAPRDKPLGCCGEACRGFTALR